MPAQAISGTPSPLAHPLSVAIAAGRALLILDCVGLLLLWPIAMSLAGPQLPTIQAAIALTLFPAIALVTFYAVGLYRREAGASFRQAFNRIPIAAVTGTLVGCGAMFFLAPQATGLGLPASICFFTSAASARITFELLRKRGVICRRLLILGAGKRAWDLVHLLHKEGRTPGYQITFVQEPALGPVDPRIQDGSLGQVLLVGSGGIRDVASQIEPDEIVVAPDERRGMDVYGLLDCKIAGYPVSEYLTFLEREVRRVDVKRIEVSWLLYSDGFQMSILDRTLKRMLDVTASLIGLLLLGPFVLLAMLAVRIEDGGPALYRQTRVTLHGRHFQILKIRTMRTDAERGGAVWAATRDARITKLGRFLRRSRLDELPQLYNVLRGDMSFVGPRPERPEFVAMLSSTLPLYKERHAAKAGLTGWAQVNYPYGASVDDARSKLSYDLYYVKNFSAVFDVLIILQTIRVVLWPPGVR